MTTKEAIQAMLDGEKVRATKWEQGCYVQFSENSGFIDESLACVDIIPEESWEIYEEPKPKQTVTIEKWLVRSEKGFFIVADGDKEYFKKMWNEEQKVKLLDTQEVEL